MFWILCIVTFVNCHFFMVMECYGPRNWRVHVDDTWAIRFHEVMLFSFLQGYLFISVLVSANSELIKLIIQSIKNDLSSRNPINVCLALQCIANIGNEEMVEAVGKEVPKLLVSPDTNDSVKQCAALCILKLFRLKTDILPPGEWTSRIVQLLNDKHLVSWWLFQDIKYTITWRHICTLEKI